MENLFFYNMGREVPQSAKREIRGGRLSGKTDINPMWRIKKLTELFGPCGIGWYYKSVREWLEPYGDCVAAFVKIELYIRTEEDDEWSMPIQGTGGSMFVELESKGPHVSDECFKMATTDAISVACKQLGIGADVYWEKDHTKYQTSQKQSEPEDAELVSLRKQLETECRRCGYGASAIRRTYKVDDIQELTKLQLKDAIKRMKNLPDKKE